MAVLPDQSRVDVWADLMRQLSTERQTVAITKDELRAAVNAIDDFLESNATAINNAFPAAAKAGLTTAQKARVLAYVALKRWGGM